MRYNLNATKFINKKALEFLVGDRLFILSSTVRAMLINAIHMQHKGDCKATRWIENRIEKGGKPNCAKNNGYCVTLPQQLASHKAPLLANHWTKVTCKWPIEETMDWPITYGPCGPVIVATRHKLSFTFIQHAGYTINYIIVPWNEPESRGPDFDRFIDCN